MRIPKLEGLIVDSTTPQWTGVSIRSQKLSIASPWNPELHDRFVPKWDVIHMYDFIFQAAYSREFLSSRNSFQLVDRVQRLRIIRSRLTSSVNVKLHILANFNSFFYRLEIAAAFILRKIYEKCSRDRRSHPNAVIQLGKLI